MESLEFFLAFPDFCIRIIDSSFSEEQSRLMFIEEKREVIDRICEKGSRLIV